MVKWRGRGESWRGRWTRKAFDVIWGFVGDMPQEGSTAEKEVLRSFNSAHRFGVRGNLDNGIRNTRRHDSCLQNEN